MIQGLFFIPSVLIVVNVLIGLRIGKVKLKEGVRKRFQDDRSARSAKISDRFRVAGCEISYLVRTHADHVPYKIDFIVGTKTDGHVCIMVLPSLTISPV